MRKKSVIENLIARRIVILDGATGTELQKRGMPAGVCPEQWCMDNPGIARAIAAEYRAAGADIVSTPTFGGNGIKLAQYGLGDVRRINGTVARNLRDFLGDDAFIAGDIGPTGRFVDPFGDLPFEEAVALFKEQIAGLLEGDVDLFIIETMMDIQEVRAALIALRELTDAFVIASLTVEAGGRTLTGVDPLAALITLQSLGADAVGLNCSVGPREMTGLIGALKPYATAPLVAKPNAGMPELIDGATVFPMGPQEFAGAVRDLVNEGANLVGGCCGTTPAHVAALMSVLKEMTPQEPRRSSLAALSSARRAEILEVNGPLTVVGERINPTGKKDLQQELREDSWRIVRAMARDQEFQGARLLDINVGVPGIDQAAAMEKAVKELAAATSLPLVIDSSDPAVIERALRLYPGRALVNSISGEEDKLKRLLPVAARYGAMFILLPLADGGVPESFEERRIVAERILAEAEGQGFTKDDVVIDGLVMTASAKPEAPAATLKMIEWAAGKGCNTIVGLSNVSFGLPERIWLNAAFLAMAVGRGLTMAIANPAAAEVMNAAAAADLLAGRDRDAGRYINRFAGPSAAKVPAAATEKPRDLRGRLAGAILDGDKDGIGPVLAEAIAAGEEAQDLVREVLIPAITEVGERYERREFFLPQLMASAESMKKAMIRLEPLLRTSDGAGAPRGTILMATVEGDIHDIGKSIVSLLLSNYGFEVIDLGKDVPAGRIIAEAKERNPHIIGLSALMTTTMVAMEKVAREAQAAKLPCRILVGGAVVTKAYAESIGAFYAKDGVEAVRMAEKLLSRK